MIPLNDPELSMLQLVLDFLIEIQVIWSQTV